MSGRQGTYVTLFGSNFDVSPPTQPTVKFGEKPATVVSYTNSQIVALVPTGFVSKTSVPVTITVVTIGGPASSTDNFEVLPTIPKEGKEVKERKEKDSREKIIIRENIINEKALPQESVFQAARMSPSLSSEEQLTPLGQGHLTHFITPDLRPDLESSALNRETDLKNTEPIALSQQLQKPASNVKQAKDKDVEKLSEQ